VGCFTPDHISSFFSLLDKWTLLMEIKIKKSLLSFALVSIFFNIPESKASVLQVSNDANWGANSIIYDSATGLDWLKPILTIGQSYDNVYTLLGAGNLAGFSYANHNQITQLFSDSGLPTQNNFQSYYGNSSPDKSEQYLFNSVIDMFGATINDMPWAKVVLGISAESSVVTEQTGLKTYTHYLATIQSLNGLASPGVIYVSDSVGTDAGGGSFAFDNIGRVDIGSWLVKQHIEAQPSSAPLPSPVALFASGLFVLSFSRRKKKQLNVTV
jgi:hypothetical protein